MGGGTTKVGDPSFRAEERPLLTDAQIDANIAGIKRAFAPYVRFGDGPTDAIMVNNAEWLDGLNYLGFLRDIGRHFSVNRMLSFESVKSRLDREQSLSFLEFNYMILQAYDFLELNRRYGCLLQMGGVGPVGQHRQRGRPDAPGDRRRGLRADLAAADHAATGARWASRPAGAVWLNGDLLQPLRVLAVLAQHDRCRCGPVPEALHRAAGGRMRPAGRAWRVRDQRGQDRAGQCGDDAAARGRGGGGGRSHGARGVREGRDRATICRR